MNDVKGVSPFKKDGLVDNWNSFYFFLELVFLYVPDLFKSRSGYRRPQVWLPAAGMQESPSHFSFVS